MAGAEPGPEPKPLLLKLGLLLLTRFGPLRHHLLVHARQRGTLQRLPGYRALQQLQHPTWKSFTRARLVAGMGSQGSWHETAAHREALKQGNVQTSFGDLNQEQRWSMARATWAAQLRTSGLPPVDPQGVADAWSLLLALSHSKAVTHWGGGKRKDPHSRLTLTTPFPGCAPG